MSRAALAKTLGGTGAAAALIAILGAIYADEGGYVNHPSDPGGATNHGITQEVARQHGYQVDMRFFPRHCAGSAQVCADDIYIDSYIKPMTGGQDMPLLAIDPAVSEELANTATNMGLQRPSRWFQQALRQYGYPVAVDGKIGPRTVRYAREFRMVTGWRGCRLMLDNLDARQRAEYDRIVRARPASKVFYKGWINRRIGNVDRRKCALGLTSHDAL